MRALHPNALVLDAGDFSDLAKAGGSLKSDFIYRMMARMRYDAVTFGSRELQYGPGHFEPLVQDGPVLLMTNLYEQHGATASQVGERFLIRDVDGIRVGVFGMIDPQVLLEAHQEVPDYHVADPLRTAEQTLQEFQESGVEIVVLLAQMDLSTVETIVRQVPGIDVVVAGRRAGVRATHMSIGNTIVIRSGSKGQHVGYLDVVVDPHGEIVEYGGRAALLGKQVRTDPDVQRLVNEVKAEVEKLQKKGEQTRQTELESLMKPDRFLGALMCARCHLPEYERWESSGHARAFQTLVTLGMQTSDECLACHVVGYGEDTGFLSPETQPDLASVQCESCHRIGTEHAVGSEREAITAEACLTCHDSENSPEFEAAAYMDRIRHWE